MKWVRLGVVGLLVLGFTPGLSEVARDAAHLVLEGHSAHALEHAEHESPGPEHGCSGAHHRCPCHASVSLVVGDPVFVPVAPRARLGTRPDADATRSDGVARSIDRPPRV